MSERTGLRPVPIVALARAEVALSTVIQERDALEGQRQYLGRRMHEMEAGVIRLVAEIATANGVEVPAGELRRGTWECEDHRNPIYECVLDRSEVCCIFCGEPEERK